jgi:hypothetical protein
MPEINTYQMRFWGSGDGYDNHRLRIQLNDGNRALGWIHFHDEGTAVPDDFVNPSGQIIMHMPSSMAESVIGTLRNEKPVFITFAWGHGVLTTGSEPIGEEEA